MIAPRSVARSPRVSIILWNQAIPNHAVRRKRSIPASRDAEVGERRVAGFESGLPLDPAGRLSDARNWSTLSSWEVRETLPRRAHRRRSVSVGSSPILRSPVSMSVARHIRRAYSPLSRAGSSCRVTYSMRVPGRGRSHEG